MPRTATTRAGKPKRSTGRKPARAMRPRRQRRNEGLLRDILSVALIAAGLLALASLLLPRGTGSAGQMIAAALHALAGRGGFVIPLGVITLGVLLLLDPARVTLDEVSVSIGVLFVSGIALLHVYGVPRVQDHDLLQCAHYGGWIGALIGGTLRGWVGSVGAYILLFFTTLISLLLMIDVPLPDILRSAGREASRGADAVRRARGMRPLEANGERTAANGEKKRAKSQKSPFPDFDAAAEEPEEPVQPEKPEKPAKEGRKKRGKGKEEPAEQILAEEPLAPLGIEPFDPFAEAGTASEIDPADLPATRMWSAFQALPETEALAETEAPEEEAPAAESAPANGKRKSKAAGDDTADAPAAEEASEPAAPPKEYETPPPSLLEYTQVLPEGPGATSDTARNIKILEETLAQFKIEAKVVEIAQGPAFTRYEIRLAPGIRVHRIESLGDNIAMNLAALDVRIQAPIPGKAAIGIEVPNKATALVSLREVIESPDFQNATSALTFALGKDVTGKAWCADMTRMPHLLIGGATNSGKSVCLNSLIASILFRAKPDEVKFLLIDPKRVELSLFDGIPHLLYPVITDVKQAAGMLNWAIREMDRRYELLNKAGSRNITSYNSRAADENLEHLPFIVIVVDELADLMMQVGAEVEQSICRLAQLARAIGIHLVIATQRPSVDVITGLIKANISSRIAFAVSSHIDSRTILDKRGAERLLGRGDMLFDPIGASKPVRIQGAYLSEREVETIVEYLRRQAEPVYTAAPIEAPTAGGPGGGSDPGADDDVYEAAVRVVVTTRRASTSMLQRKFSIGYTRAARLIDIMEERGIVSALDGAKPREVLISREQMEQFFSSPLNDPLPAAAGGDEDAL